MRICGEDPSNPEYSMCGFAFDAPYTEDDCELFELSDGRKAITCCDCKERIQAIYRTFTKSGRLRR